MTATPSKTADPRAIHATHKNPVDSSASPSGTRSFRKVAVKTMVPIESVTIRLAHVRTVSSLGV
jgi:hypothetical protein